MKLSQLFNIVEKNHDGPRSGIRLLHRTVRIPDDERTIEWRGMEEGEFLEYYPEQTAC